MTTGEPSARTVPVSRAIVSNWLSGVGFETCASQPSVERTPMTRAPMRRSSPSVSSYVAGVSLPAAVNAAAL